MFLISLSVVGGVLYAMIAGFALVMTSAERRATGNTSAFYGALSICACALWPVTLACVAIAAAVTPRRLPAFAPTSAPVQTSACDQQAIA